MKKILFYFSDYSGGNIFDSGIRDRSSDPFIYLKNKLLSLGYNLEVYSRGDDLPQNTEWVLFVNSPFKKKRIFQKSNDEVYERCLKKNIKTALFLWEGPSVRRDNYIKRVHEKFPVIFTWNDSLVDNKKFFKFYLPVANYKNFPALPIIDFKNKKLLLNISRNRASSHPRELYSEREKTIAYFSDNLRDNFDLYGMGWNKPRNYFEKIFPFLIKRYSSYRGEVKNKIDVMPYYKFSLCYENLSGEKGYVTEKIFDCMNFGTVPVYWGAENITDYVDQKAFIERRMFKSNRELANFLINIKENKYNEYINAINKYLNSDKFKLFLPENLSNTIMKTLNL